jgi:diguanylate cyclase (GGDEF)-like protein
MNLPSSTLLLFVIIAAVANVILLAVYARHRADRTRHLVDVGGFMSSSYASDDDAQPIAGGWLPPDEASEGWPASRGAGSIGSASASWPTSSAPPADPEEEPFHYPEPTSLEQRGALEDDGAVGADEDDEDPDDDADWDDEDPDESFEAEADADSDLDDTEADHEDDAEMEATPTMNDDTEQPEPETAPLSVVPAARGPRGRDPLTGMLDASAFEEVMAQEDAREQRYGRPATVIVFEVDGLAKLVDRLGPEPGDRIETALGDTITRLARRADHVARLERGRYAVLLPETDEVAAINYVERIRRACDLWLESGAIAMRLAIGWASTSGDVGLNGAIRVATDRMRSEMRRNARGVGDETPDLELIETDGRAEAAAGL